MLELMAKILSFLLGPVSFGVLVYAMGWAAAFVYGAGYVAAFLVSLSALAVNVRAGKVVIK